MSDLRERVIHALIESPMHGFHTEPDDISRTADALMPLIAQAQAQAWDQGWDASVDAADRCVIAGGDPCGDCAICRPPNPYTERTDR